MNFVYAYQTLARIKQDTLPERTILMKNLTPRAVMLIVAVAFVIVLSTLAISTSSKSDIPPKADSAVTVKQATGYVLRDFGGKIAVFNAIDLLNPIYITDYDTAVLPVFDRDMLIAGIAVQTQEDIAGLLEDFGS